jgi:hypothetical protein
MGDHQGGQGQRAVGGFEAAASANVMFRGAVEAFDELLEMAMEFGLVVEILQANDGSTPDGILRVSLPVGNEEPARLEARRRCARFARG